LHSELDELRSSAAHFPRQLQKVQHALIEFN
jgi:hypothetical protein